MPKAFDAAFGKGDITVLKIEQALATFERSIVSNEAPFDHWVAGDDNAIGLAAKRGFALFNGKANCAACHSGWAFTDASFHDIGVAKNDDIGRGRLFPSSVKLKYAFKTPTLRDVARRGPYMHDGSLATLEDVIDLYDRGGIDRPAATIKFISSICRRATRPTWSLSCKRSTAHRNRFRFPLCRGDSFAVLAKVGSQPGFPPTRE